MQMASQFIKATVGRAKVMVEHDKKRAQLVENINTNITIIIEHCNSNTIPITLTTILVMCGHLMVMLMRILRPLIMDTIITTITIVIICCSTIIIIISTDIITITSPFIQAVPIVTIIPLTDKMRWIIICIPLSH